MDDAAGNIYLALPMPPPAAARAAARFRAAVHSFSVPYCGGVIFLTLFSCFVTGAVCVSNLCNSALKAALA